MQGAWSWQQLGLSVSCWLIWSEAWWSSPSPLSLFSTSMGESIWKGRMHQGCFDIAFQKYNTRIRGTSQNNREVKWAALTIGMTTPRLSCKWGALPLAGSPQDVSLDAINRGTEGTFHEHFLPIIIGKVTSLYCATKLVFIHGDPRKKTNKIVALA
jgi:hypothetical protein